MGLGFLYKKKIIARLEKRTFTLMCFVMKITWVFQFTFQIKHLKTRRIYYL